ncbi:hypothetical protein THICB1_200040 [Thiomonas arsenitoxydans]|uniref:Uncharacterized protein n=1 Tax=Thiomonas arsenitoxydans (strain DSM 22701 / CIP 110005 / 3As) TaxID=426114 RepID=A0ABP1Z2H7_THIA3|nr:hypothetical protein THICB1_200040 [Thiomonas arsenitoxydans]
MHGLGVVRAVARHGGGPVVRRPADFNPGLPRAFGEPASARKQINRFHVLCPVFFAALAAQYKSQAPGPSVCWQY